MDFSSVRVTHEYCKGFGSPNGLSICRAEGAESCALVSEHSSSQVARVVRLDPPGMAVISDHIGDTMVNPYDVAISASGTFALVADLNSPQPKHIDLATKRCRSPFPVCRCPRLAASRSPPTARSRSCAARGTTASHTWI